MYLENIMLSDINQSQKHKYYVIFEISKRVKLLESRMVVPRVEGEEMFNRHKISVIQNE